MTKLKPPKPYVCIDCLYEWFSKSKLKKPTCPKCHGHRTYKIPSKKRDSLK